MVPFAELPLQQSQAIVAYQRGDISIGKLAKVMGMHVLQLRRWLEERDIVPRNAYGDEDAVHA